MDRTRGWEVSEAATAAIRRAIGDFVKNHGRPQFDYYPLITWRSGGTASKSGSAKIDLPDRYDLGLIPRADLGASNFIAVESRAFGALAFVPRDRDAASSRRLIDFDGQDIVVR
jgi:hypothetical protein